MCGTAVEATNASYRQNPKGQRQSWKELGRTLSNLLVWGVVLVLGLLLVAYWLTPEADRLADQYHVSKDKIVIEAKSHGCDFNDAPLGNKHCHYEKSVDVARACPGTDCQVTAVYVSWRKVEE